MTRPILRVVVCTALTFALPPQSLVPSSPAAPPPAPRGTLFDRVRATCPEQVPPFVRSGFRKYDERGEHASVGYNRFFLLTTTVTAFTAYFYPLPRAAAGKDALEEPLARARQDVLDAHPGAEVVATQPVTAEKKGRSFKGTRVTFKYEEAFGAPGKKQTVLSELYLFRDGDRAVKYRVTFPAAEEKTEREHLQKFLAAFPWPD